MDETRRERVLSIAVVLCPVLAVAAFLATGASANEISSPARWVLPAALFGVGLLGGVWSVKGPVRPAIDPQPLPVRSAALASIAVGLPALAAVFGISRAALAFACGSIFIGGMGYALSSASSVLIKLRRDDARASRTPN